MTPTQGLNTASTGKNLAAKFRQAKAIQAFNAGLPGRAQEIVTTLASALVQKSGEQFADPSFRRVEDFAAIEPPASASEPGQEKIQESKLGYAAALFAFKASDALFTGLDGEDLPGSVATLKKSVETSFRRDHDLEVIAWGRKDDGSHYPFLYSHDVRVSLDEINGVVADSVAPAPARQQSELEQRWRKKLHLSPDLLEAYPELARDAENYFAQLARLPVEKQDPALQRGSYSLNFIGEHCREAERYVSPHLTSNDVHSIGLFFMAAGVTSFSKE